ncbi:DUF4954 family protein [candidate division KSB1 bacterium]|nr:DUF4954 family protein [candidate division KSB1 bacterium]
MNTYKKLSVNQIEILKKNHCHAENWNLIKVGRDFDPDRIRFTEFFGKVTIGNNNNNVNIDGLNIPCGIYHAKIANCNIGHNVYIANIGSAIRNYNIEDNVIIQNVSQLVVEKGADFGNGIVINVVNEAGGREVTLYEDLNAQFAYLQAFYRHDKDFQIKLQKLIKGHIKTKNSKAGKICNFAQIIDCGALTNVNVGPNAVIKGSRELYNGTVQSCPEDPTFIGTGVILKDFIVSEGAHIDDNSILEKVFVGQGSRVGKSLSAENSLLFANCEAFQSEICSIFAGPYSVTHHKSTLLIAGLFSFYNAGSGTNLSNHMYKLGPVHQGVFERGCKTGSLSYLLLESHISPFSVVIGKHKTNVNIEFLPFSYLSEENGGSFLIPGKNLFSVGTARDGGKWPNRDQRRATLKRDLIIFDVFSPFTVEKMRRGRDILQHLYRETPREVDTIQYGGVNIKRLILRKGIKYYSLAIDRYLIGKVMTKIEDHIGNLKTWKDVIKLFQFDPEHRCFDKWTDMAGLLTLSGNVEKIVQNVKSEKISLMNDLQRSLSRAYESYYHDEWKYICSVLEKEYNFSYDQLNRELMSELVNRWETAAVSLNALMLEDSKMEYGKNSKIGYGLGQNEEIKDRDFNAVRGNFENNLTINNLNKEYRLIKKRPKEFMEMIKSIHN